MAFAPLLLAAVTSFGSNPGALDMYEYVPAGLAPGRPLVVVMHGCSQSAAGMEAAGWNVLADFYRFAVVYPQQRVANDLLSCFRWSTPEDQARVGGEPESIAQMVDYEIAMHGIDRDRVYVTGVSSGGAFTAVMLATYPDRFAAGSVMSGTPYGCATDTFGASECLRMSASAQRTAAQWGALVRAADPGFAGPYPRVQIWHGMDDLAVNPAGATEIAKQWTDVWGTDAMADATDSINGSTRTQFLAGGTVAVELYLVAHMGHAIAVGDDPLGACPGMPGLLFTDAKICSTLRAADFFGLLQTAPGPDAGATMGDTPDAGAPTGATDPPRHGGCAVGGGPGLAVALLLLRRRRARA